jgi:uncharacterized membrane protein YoaK (UPF0700 family)
LSGVAGYVDAAGFVSLVGFFPAHITGELVGDAIAISAGHPSRHAHLWAFPVFVGAVIVATLLARVFRHYGLKARAGLLALLTVALTLFAASNAIARLFHKTQFEELFRGGFAVAAMGFQSALMRESLTGSCPTTVMTGNLTQVAIDMVDHCVARFTSNTLPGGRARIRLTPVAGSLVVFALSAALGGLLTRKYGPVSVALPAAFAAGLMLEAWREDLRARVRLSKTAAPIPTVTPEPSTLESASDGPAGPAAAIDEPAAGVYHSETRLKVEPSVALRRRRRVTGPQFRRR